MTRVRFTPAPRPAAWPALSVDAVDASAYRIPTDRPESDGTLEWSATTLVIARVHGHGEAGVGYTYSDAAAAECVRRALAPVIEKRAFASPAEAWRAMAQRVRNLGFCGIAAMAVSAVDTAMWDLWGRLLGVPIGALIGRVRDTVPVYGSGGFTSYTTKELQGQLAGWVESGIPRVKMKVGRDPDADPGRVRAAREAIGADAELFVDANGAYSVRQALVLAERFALEAGVTWIEEPRPADDMEGTRRVRERAPLGMEIAGGEYIYRVSDARALALSGGLDVLQADVTRCGGITGVLRVAALADAFSLPLSTHGAPALSARVGVALTNLRHIEYFHDHVRIEAAFLDGAGEPQAGRLRPDPSRPGLGIEIKERDLRRYAVD